jgi:hypothetical protein
MYIKSIDPLRMFPEAQDNPPSNPIRALVVAAAVGLVLWAAIGAAFYKLVL